MSIKRLTPELRSEVETAIYRLYAILSNYGESDYQFDCVYDAVELYIREEKLMQQCTDIDNEEDADGLEDAKREWQADNMRAVESAVRRGVG